MYYLKFFLHRLLKTNFDKLMIVSIALLKQCRTNVVKKILANIIIIKMLRTKDYNFVKKILTQVI